MQLVREIEVGMDVDGDMRIGPPDLPFRTAAGARGPFSGGGAERSRGCSFRPNGSSRMAFVARGGFPPVLQSRVPSVINSPGITSVKSPFPRHPSTRICLSGWRSVHRRLEKNGSQVVRSPVINTVAGAADPHQVLDDIEWASQSASSIAYASHLRRDPLNGVPAKSVIIQFAYGDRLVPNRRRRRYFTREIWPTVPPSSVPISPFLCPPFLSRVLRRPVSTRLDLAITSDNAHVKDIAIDAQQQIASFFDLDGGDYFLDPTTGIRSPILMTRVRSLRCLSNHLCLKPSTITASDLTSGTEPCRRG